ncbi:xanthine dehydrogenase family protein molybdopterin-binding subunit [Rhizobium lentis]|uniref:Xanthine dehydrogenase family protein molybdopterin-binding subunit n=1 Tax=Rhizobium lentis TaxID=1138194 RepID=A0ABS7I915_9HYPH|nr:molybdopterin cofactor-binding domain-containing protein [Rhizobium lentis]MBX5088332.1 xanthine dehydrogenase family protein molybdopterin-binding subunit [Rhizobium lentis]
MTALPKFEVTRRWFLASLGSAAVVSGFLPNSAYAAVPAVPPLHGGYSPTMWYTVHGDGKIVVHVPLAEMGQHVGTALARIVAEELEADWEHVEVVHVDPDPKWGYMITGGSWSVNQKFLLLSRAGAAGRTAFIEAGAMMLGAAPSECSARASRVVFGDKSVSYGDIVSAGAITRTFSEEELKGIKLKPPHERRLLNGAFAARDIPAKVNGQAVFGIDRSVEGMLFARPVMPPTRYGSKITSWSDARAKAVPGYIRTVEIEDPSDTCQGWLVVVAEDWPAASEAVELLDVQYQAGSSSQIGEDAIIAEGLRLVNQPDGGSLFYQSGDVSELASPDAFEAVYITHTALQMPLEPLNALVWHDGDLWRIHTSDQHPSASHPLVARALGVLPEKVAMESSYLGGGFGRRLFCEFIVPAALTAKAMGQPVKLVFSRTDDSKLCQPRSPTVQLIRSRTNGDGTLASYEYRGAAAWPTHAQNPAFLSDAVDKKGKIDAFAISGADHWYDAAVQSIRTMRNEVAHDVFLPGYLRSVSAGYTTWAVETYIDELAYKLGRDPAQYRRSLLTKQGRNSGEAPQSVGGAQRLRDVLDKVIAKSGWADRSQLADGEGMGIALGTGQERTMPTWSATVARVAVDRSTGKVSVKRLVSVVDAGVLVHPDGALAQVEGGMLWGLSLALHEGTEFENGLPRDLNFNSYTPVRMQDVPDVEIEFVANDHMPVGLGEPGVITVAPAIGNAIFHATGARLRELPIRPDAVLKALEV